MGAPFQKQLSYISVKNHETISFHENILGAVHIAITGKYPFFA
jgi:hypothetical protein